MNLDWKKVVVILAIVGVVIVLALSGKLSEPTLTATVTALLGWLMGLFTESKAVLAKDEPPKVSG